MGDYSVALILFLFLLPFLLLILQDMLKDIMEHRAKEGNGLNAKDLEAVAEYSLNSIISYMRRVEGVKDKEKVLVFRLPTGDEVSLQLTLWGSRWQVSVPVEPGRWEWITFDDYNEALRFFEGIAEELREHFEVVLGGE